VEPRSPQRGRSTSGLSFYPRSPCRLCQLTTAPFLPLPIFSRFSAEAKRRPQPQVLSDEMCSCLSSSPKNPPMEVSDLLHVLTMERGQQDSAKLSPSPPGLRADNRVFFLPPLRLRAWPPLAVGHHWKEIYVSTFGINSFFAPSLHVVLVVVVWAHLLLLFPSCPFFLVFFCVSSVFTCVFSHFSSPVSFARGRRSHPDRAILTVKAAKVRQYFFLSFSTINRRRGTLFSIEPPSALARQHRTSCLMTQGQPTPTFQVSFNVASMSN